MGDVGIKRWKHRAVPTKGPKTCAVRETSLPRQQYARGCCLESHIPWIQRRLGTKHVVLLVERGKPLILLFSYQGNR